MKVSVIGTGYVGLITGLCLSKLGNEIRCFDLSEDRIRNINNCIPPFYEEGLYDLLKEQLISKRFKASYDLYETIFFGDLIFITVGTPSKDSGEIDLSYIRESIKEIGKVLKNINFKKSIIIKSTVLPRTTDTFVKNILEEYSGKLLGEFGLGMNPEFLREGKAIYDFMNPDRLILGYEDDFTKNKLKEIYDQFNCPKIYVNSRTAEMIKYFNNSLLALLISFSNEISNLSTLVSKIDNEKLFEGVYLDKRWSLKSDNKIIFPEILSYLKAGCGFGGSCFPKDVKALAYFGKSEGNKMAMQESIIEVNKNQPRLIIQRLIKDIDIKKKSILILGLAFKEGTDDLRESPSLKLIDEFMNMQKVIWVHDPKSINNFKKQNPNNKNILIAKNWKKSVELSDLIIIMTKWPIYLDILKIDCSEKIIFDSRKILDKNIVKCKAYMSF